ncbi:MAG: SDR family oxidoreductase [Actinobacteria bacterium]|nr:SDR family oxidoreductase [Actinomycetota bacterium]
MSGVAVVTGAGSGVGKATAARLEKDGFAVAGLDIKNAPYQCDVSDEDQVAAAIAQVAADLGRPTVLCNVAGIGRFQHTADATLDDWNRTIAVNLTGTFLMCRTALPYLLDGGGAIVNVASTAGVMGQPYSAAYCASKGGVVQLTKALAVEYLERGVRVNAVAPGGVDTPLLGSFMPPEDGSRRLLARLMTPMGFCTADEVAGIIAFLAGPDSRYMSGSIVSFDGGLTA